MVRAGLPAFLMPVVTPRGVTQALARTTVAFCLLMSASRGASVEPDDAPGHYSPAAAFAPLTFPRPPSQTRSAAGAPTAAYWQNQADYEIRARLDPVAKRITGTVVITYTNNSPDTLATLWLQLDQNVYRADSRFTATGQVTLPSATEGVELRRVEIGGTKGFRTARYDVSDTRMETPLPTALPGHGHKLSIRIAYSYIVPGRWGGRTGWSKARDGDIYLIAQWYPRMAVYDDIRGWDTLPYLGNEFYLEYGNFDYRVTVPADYLVAGSGTLINPGEVLTAIQQRRLARARSSDATVVIRSAQDVDRARGDAAGTRCWHFHMSHTRDVAFAASPGFLWDAARMKIPGGRDAVAMSYYPAESAGESAWGRSTEYLKHAVENFSRRWSAYPWPTAINVAGGADGMEYPGLLFDSADDKGRKLFWITAHEIGHSWFPMIVGFNERRDAWMDEGFNTFIDVNESDILNHGEYGPKRDAEYAPGGAIQSMRSFRY